MTGDGRGSSLAARMQARHPLDLCPPTMPRKSVWNLLNPLTANEKRHFLKRAIILRKRRAFTSMHNERAQRNAGSCLAQSTFALQHVNCAHPAAMHLLCPIPPMRAAE